jgi:cytochrome d ubiquinol oxidase subunit I
VVAGFAGLRYLRSTREEDREFFDWMGHWALVWGFGFLLLQPIIGFGYMKSIREQNSPAFEYIMLGDKSWLFNLLMIELAIMGVASVAYCLHKIRFAAKPMPTLRNMTVGALWFMGLFTLLNVIPANMDLVPQLGWVFFGGEDTRIPLGAMYPWKYVGLIGLMLVGVFALALYLKVTAGGFHWGQASRWSQYALIATAVTVLATMITMGYTRETARRGAEPGYLINGCITLEQKIVASGCPEAPEKSIERGTF